MKLVSQERVQQRAAEQIEDAPQSPAEVVEAVTLVPHESEVVAGGMSEHHRLVLLGVFFQEVDVDQHDHRDCTHKKEAWVTVAFWDEGLSLIGLVSVLCEQSESFFQATDTGSVVVTATCATSVSNHIQNKTNGGNVHKSTTYEVIAVGAVVHASRTGERSSHGQGTSMLDITPLPESMESTSGVSRSKRQPHSNKQQQAVQR